MKRLVDLSLLLPENKQWRHPVQKDGSNRGKPGNTFLPTVTPLPTTATPQSSRFSTSSGLAPTTAFSSMTAFSATIAYWSYTREQYLRRMMSTSYALTEGGEERSSWLGALEKLFDRFETEGRVTAVSYTHLDVYKRQLME